MVRTLRRKTWWVIYEGRVKEMVGETRGNIQERRGGWFAAGDSVNAIATAVATVDAGQEVFDMLSLFLPAL